MAYWMVLTGGLYIFWLLLSGFWDNSLLLILGMVSTAATLSVTRRMRKSYRYPADVRIFLGLPGYLAWLLWQIWLANWDTIKRIWAPGRYPPTPTVATLKMSQKTDVGKATYANSITLTPGTVTIDIRHNDIIVHALSRTAIADLREGEMDSRVSKLEPRT